MKRKTDGRGGKRSPAILISLSSRGGLVLLVFLSQINNQNKKWILLHLKYADGEKVHLRLILSTAELVCVPLLSSYVYDFPLNVYNMLVTSP